MSAPLLVVLWLVAGPVAALMQSASPSVREGIDKTKADLHSPDPAVRRQAGAALASLPGSEGIKALISAFADPDFLVGHDASESLGLSRRRDAVVPLLEALKDPSSRVRLQAAGALFTLAAQGVSDPSELDPLIAALQDDEPVAAVAAMALGQLRDKRAFPALAAAYRSGNRGASDALAVLKDDRALDLLLSEFRNPDADRRAQAAGALGASGDIRAVKPLLALLGDEDPNVRIFTAMSLERLAGSGVTDAAELEPLVRALKDTEAGVQVYTAKTLGHLKDRRALPALRAAAAVKGEDREVVAAMKDAIGEISSAHPR